MTANLSGMFPNKPLNKWIWPEPFLETLHFLDKLCYKKKKKEKINIY